MKALCKVLCICGMIAGCDVRDSDPTDYPVGVVAQPSVSTPTPPTTAIMPALGWAPAGAPTVYTCNVDGEVAFHSGVWVVPITATPGQSLSEVTFTIEAPTGHAGDPSSIIVELFSNQSAAVIGHTTLTPFGLGAFVNGNIPLSPARVVASGETLQLVFVPLLANGDYPTSDTLVDNVGMAMAPHTRPVWPVLRFGGASQSEAADPVSAAHPPVRRFNTGASIYAEIPFEAGETITGFSMELAGDGVVDGSLEIVYGTRGGGQLQIGTLANFTNVPASWTTFRPSIFAPTKLSGDGQLSLILTANTANLYWGYIWPVFSRP